MAALLVSVACVLVSVVVSMSTSNELRDFLVSKGCPGSSRDLTKVLLWLQNAEVTCPEDLPHLRKVSTFVGADNFRCDIIAFIDLLVGVSCCAFPFPISFGTSVLVGHLCQHDCVIGGSESVVVAPVESSGSSVPVPKRPRLAAPMSVCHMVRLVLRTFALCLQAHVQS